MRITYVTKYNVLDVKNMLKLLYAQQFEDVNTALETLEIAYKQLSEPEKMMFNNPDEQNDVQTAIDYFKHLYNHE